MNREIKFRAWDGLRITTNGIMFNNSTGCIDIPNGSVLMKYTGLKDRNGKEIYEGDILKSDYISKPFAIEWNSEVCCHDWYVMTESEKIGNDICKEIEDAPKKTGKIFTEIIEVIGNIYENPELL